MKNILLSGKPEDDRKRLRDCMDLKNPENSPIFLIPETVQLYEYIDELKVSDKILLVLRICNNLTGLNAVYQSDCRDENKKRINSVQELLNQVEPGRECVLTLLGDIDCDEDTKKAVRNRLVEVMQQLVYLNLPLEKIQVRTENDIRVRERVDGFLARLENLKELAAKAKQEMEQELPNFLSQGSKEKAEWMEGSLGRIQMALEKAGESELKINCANKTRRNG